MESAQIETCHFCGEAAPHEAGVYRVGNFTFHSNCWEKREVNSERWVKAVREGILILDKNIERKVV